MRANWRISVLVGSFAVIVGMAAWAATAEPEKSNATSGPFDERLREIAKTYKKYGKVDPSARRAPELCAAPRVTGSPFQSTSDDETSHGHKLYYLYAAKKPEYLAAAKKDSPVGQVLVKEAYAAVEAGAKSKAPPNETTVGIDGKIYHTGQAMGLFVMFKADPKTKDTDDGWVYGTVSEKGEVTSAGRVESCMACHKDATRDHLFGLGGTMKRADKAETK